MNSKFSPYRLDQVTCNYDNLRVPVKKADRKPGKFPYYGASGIVDYVDNYLFSGDYLLISEDGENLNSRKQSIAFMASGKFWVNNHAHILQGNDLADTRYLAYYIENMDIKPYLSGSTRPKITKSSLNSIELVLPQIEIQKYIVGILGTLDDKIELNHKMNETLEAMAKAIFKSRFVDFDTVHAKMEGRQPFGMDAETAALFPDSFEDSKLGLIPKGWGVGTLSDLVNISSGKRPNIKFAEPIQDAIIPLYGGGGIMAFVKEPLFKDSILLTGRVGTLGLVFRISDPCWASDNTLVIQPKKEEYFELNYFQMQEIDYASLNRGSTQPLVTQTDLKKELVILPDEPIIGKYHVIASQLLMKQDLNNAENKSLSHIRDTLLPKLLSGEIDVGDLKISEGN